MSEQVYGIVGNPVGHSRSPLLHNNGFQRVGHDAVYVPLLVDDLPGMLSHPLAQDFSGLSVTIPHKVLPLQVSMAGHRVHWSAFALAYCPSLNLKC